MQLQLLQNNVVTLTQLLHYTMYYSKGNITVRTQNVTLWGNKKCYTGMRIYFDKFYAFVEFLILKVLNNDFINSFVILVQDYSVLNHFLWNLILISDTDILIINSHLRYWHFTNKFSSLKLKFSWLITDWYTLIIVSVRMRNMPCLLSSAFFSEFNTWVKSLQCWEDLLQNFVLNIEIA